LGVVAPVAGLPVGVGRANLLPRSCRATAK
jgi:hypothetical protein